MKFWSKEEEEKRREEKGKRKIFHACGFLA
jgi:hypothetical protein